MPKTPNRRRVLAAVGALGAVPFVTRALGALPFVTHELGLNVASAAAPPVVTGKSCVLSPAMMEGPFFVEARLNRSDLTTGTTKPGVVQGLPLILDIDLASVQSAGCVAIAGMQVDVWHADATGEYSGGASGAGQSNAAGQAFLRGYQVSDANGRVAFKTIYPGWYPGRTIHILVKARLFNAAGNTTYVFTSQLFFDDAVNDKVMAMSPYNARGARNVRNAGENISGNTTRALVVLRPTDGSRGYLGAVTLGLRLPA
jgi:protocatechuate 3,4-dioxygenase beta subunit